MMQEGEMNQADHQGADYPPGITLGDHIAHDMRHKRFLERSTIEEFLNERQSWKQSLRITTDYIYPSIADRRFDWSAVDDRSYGGEPSDLVGYGASEMEAIENLLQQSEEMRKTGKK